MSKKERTIWKIVDLVIVLTAFVFFTLFWSWDRFVIFAVVYVIVGIVWGVSEGFIKAAMRDRDHDD